LQCSVSKHMIDHRTVERHDLGDRGIQTYVYSAYTLLKLEKKSSHDHTQFWIS